MRIHNSLRTNARGPVAAFTLIELIGVLAVIIVLAAYLIPKVIVAIDESKVNSTAGGYEAIQSAAADHYGKYAGFNAVSNSGVPASLTQMAGWDSGVLIPEGLLDKPFAPGVGLGHAVHVVPGSSANNGSGYLLDGVNNSTAGMQYVVEIAITNVTPLDAFALSLAIDGAALTSTNVGQVDNRGRVCYDGSSVLYMYVTGR